MRFEEPTPPVGFGSVAHGPSPYPDDPADTVPLGRAFRKLEEVALSPAEPKVEPAFLTVIGRSIV